jgi:hypothetical protein
MEKQDEALRGRLIKDYKSELETLRKIKQDNPEADLQTRIWDFFYKHSDKEYVKVDTIILDVEEVIIGLENGTIEPQTVNY